MVARPLNYRFQVVGWSACVIWNIAEYEQWRPEMEWAGVHSNHIQLPIRTLARALSVVVTFEELHARRPACTSERKVILLSLVTSCKKFVVEKRIITHYRVSIESQ